MFPARSVSSFLTDYGNFLSVGRTFPQGAGGISERVLAEVCKVGQGVETIAGTDDRYTLLGILEVVQYAFAFLVQNPFVHRHSIHIFKKTAECGGSVSAKVGKFFHILHLVIVLHDEVLEAFRISADRIEEGADLT